MYYHFYFITSFCLQVFAISFYPPLEENKTEIRIGFLGAFKYGEGEMNLIAGALPLAVEYVNSESDFLPGHVLRFTVSDRGKPDSFVAIEKMTEMKERDVVAFIGPDHSCTPEAMVAAAWNLPMLAYKCSDIKVSNKENYRTFARTHPPSLKVSKTVISLLQHFNWTILTLVVTKEPFNLQVEESLCGLVRDHGILIKNVSHLPRNYRSIYYENLTAIIDDTYKKTRVYVLLADDYALVDFVRYMNSRDLLSSGEYIIISVESEQLHDPNKTYQFMGKEIEAAYIDKSNLNTAPFGSVLVVTPTYPMNSKDFQEKVKFYSSQPPFNIRFLEFLRTPVPFHAFLLYDAILLYAKAVTETLREGKGIRNGIEIFKHINSQTYNSSLGLELFMDENGDAEGNYTLLALQPRNTSYSMQPVGRFVCQPNETQGSFPVLELEKSINWVNGIPPRAEPVCGFDGEKCDSGTDRLHDVIIYLVCFVVVVAVAALVIRRYRYEHKLAALLWKIDSKDLVLAGPSSWQNIRDSDKDDDDDESIEPLEGQELIPSNERPRHLLGFYKGNVVYIKPVFKKSIDLTRSLRKEMIQIREIRHENINSFVGACVDSPNICIVFLYCARGSLKDILKNSDIKLDNVFIASLVADLIKGMTYIHESEIVSHGNLKSSNCLVDSRWVLQVADFGLHEFKAGRRISAKEQKRKRKGLLWTAPELLRLVDPPLRGTQKGDVYSFAIVLHEVLGRKGPWCPRTLSHQVLVERVMMGPARNGGQLVRPPITTELVSRWPESVIRCMKECWREIPASRPDFRSINIKLREMLSEVKINIFDNMLSMMEKYASDLEGLVQERTKLLMEEKKKTENLLLRMLPKPVAEQLKSGKQVEAESFDSVTIYFSDIVGFTEFSAVSTPLQVVDLLNDLYSCFDSIIGAYDVYKVETTGDSYMVVSGLPIRNGDCHAAQIAAMALHLLEAIRHFEIRHRPGDRLKLRVGIHSGPCVAGVVGLKMPRYCLFGDTVNTASRMESTGEALKIHISHSCKEILDKFGEFDIEERGLIQIRGKGEMRTYWLIGRSSRFASLSDDVKLRRHTDSRLEIRFAPRFQSSNSSKRAASGADQWQWPTAVGPNTPPMSTNSCRDLQTRKTPKNWRFIPNVQIRNCRFEPMQTDESMN